MKRRPTTSPTTAATEKPKTLTELEAELKKAQEALALHEQELDLSKRDAALQQQAFYADPRANQDEAGQAQLAEVQKHLDCHAGRFRGGTRARGGVAGESG